MLLIFLLMYCSQVYAEHTIWIPSSVSSQQESDTHFKLVKEQVEKRWRDFQSYRNFEPFRPGKSNEALEIEFENIQEIRKQIWETPDYAPAKILLELDLVRAAPECTAFSYNNTTPDYNASSLFLGERLYIACEGPRLKDVDSFFKLLKSCKITHLVRLTDAFEEKVEKCHSYWDNILSEASDGQHFLNIPDKTTPYPIRAFDMAHWRDNQGVDPKELLTLVLQVRKEIVGPDKRLLVHCSAGVGRTGTFLAALKIVDAIDRGEYFSIEEIVYQLSLQRPHSVGKSSQYVTLHRLAENYLKHKTLVFRSEVALESAFTPFSVDEVSSRMSRSTTPFTIHFQYDERLEKEKVVPLRNIGVGNLLKTEVYKTKTFTVCYPEKPRVPHHLSLSLNHENTKGIAGITEEENQDLFATIKKIAEIYKTISIQGFVIAQFDKSQEGHFGHYVVEIIPHLPSFKGIKNIVDKVECNRHILFRSANISAANYTFKEGEIDKQAQFWVEAFKHGQNPLNNSDITITYPHIRMESHQLEAEQILYNQLIELLQDKGGTILAPNFCELEIPTEPCQPIKPIKVESCAFCDKALHTQLVFEQDDVAILYNMRKPAKDSACFLLMPKRHIEKVYGLNSSEIKNMRILRAALVEVLKETRPEYEVIVYTQDDPTVGQTVFHSHEQIIAVDPATIAIAWTLMSLYPNNAVSDEEMLKVKEEFGAKIKRKLNKD